VGGVVFYPCRTGVLCSNEKFAHSALEVDDAEIVAEPGELFRDCDNCPELVVVPPWDFMMGSNPMRSPNTQSAFAAMAAAR
jgi:hypothetical protein